jgi:hypothetical protein
MQELFEPREDRGYVSDLQRPRALALALRFCRCQDEEGVWHGLAEHVRRVPVEHVAKACTVGHGPECWVVRCVCGQVEFVAASLVECRGGCGRWFVADDVGVWSARLEPSS